MSKDAAGAPDHRWPFFLILGLFLALALVYNVITPIYESPDELQHTAFVAWLAEGQGLPNVVPEMPGPWEQEGTQPPLYYWLAAQLLGWLPHNDSGNLARLNPYAGIGDPLRPDNKNRVLHDINLESWPYDSRVWFVHLVRGLSTLMAAGTLAAVYRLGRIVFPRRRGIALGMMGLVAFIPQFLFLSTSINNDNLVILIAAWVLVILAGWLCTPVLPGWLPIVGMGILLGLGALAKVSGLLLWPLAGGTMIWLGWRQKNMRWLLLSGLLVLGLAMGLAGWWFVRNQQLYGDLTAFGPHLELMGTRQRLPTKLGALQAEFRGLRYSFWALFGWFNILAPEPYYWVMDALTLTGVVGLGLYLVRSVRREPSGTRQAIVMLIAWVGLVVAAWVRWTILTPASQGRLLYPALPAIALFLVVGWATVIPTRFRRPVGIVALVLWALWAAVCPFLVIKPAYALPERLDSNHELPAALSDLHVRYEDCCELVGYVGPEGPVLPGDRVPLTLVWHAPEDVGQDYVLYVHAIAPDGQLLGQLDTFHGGGMMPTGQWRRGDVFIDTVHVPISPRAQGPALLQFSVGLHEPPGPNRLPVFSPEGQALDLVFAGEAALQPFNWPEIPGTPHVDAVFGDQILLASVEPLQAETRPGEVVTVTIQWQALDQVEGDYVGFVHLVDQDGHDVAQDDHPPLNGLYPTRLWRTGTVVTDHFELQLSDALAPGQYELWGGLYQPQSGQRLAAIEQETGERWKNDLVHIGTLTIGSSEP